MPANSTLSDKRQAIAFLTGAAVIAIAAGAIFVSMWEAEPIIAGPGVTLETTLGKIEQSLYGTPGDTPVFELAGEKPGASILVLGGTHPQEIAGMIAATIIVENVKVKQGKITVVPQANRSGFTWTEPMEAYRHHIEIKRPDGSMRWFRVGMRLTNPVDQWPDPDLFVHYPTGEQMVGHETRNLNRNHPGQSDSWLTSRVSYGLTKIAAASTMTFDQHEAQPEYSVVNTFVTHERAQEITIQANNSLTNRRGTNMPMATPQKSPVNLHGLSHREFGDFTPTLAVLAETANPAMGRFRGRLSDELVVGGKDANYVAAAKLPSDNPATGRLFVRFDENGWPLHVRVARHLASIQAIIKAYNDLHPENELIVENYPDYRSVVEKGIGAYLNPPPKAR